MIKIIEIFRRTCFNRYFELKVAEFHKQKLIKIPFYLSVGGEHIPPAMSVEFHGPIFAQHRCHSWYLSFGGDPELLLRELMGQEDGCNKGRGGSASISIKEKEFFGHSGLLGDQIPIAVGYAHASNKPTLLVAGDAAMEEDYALAAIGYAVSKKAPILFLVEDNDLSILTKKEVRRSWDIVEVAKGFGLQAKHTTDDIQQMMRTTIPLMNNLPALVNIRICRHLWHAGSGCDGTPEWNQFELLREYLKGRYEGIDDIEQNEKGKIEELCQRLLKPSER
jgi:TPP-dependent pyruvate/acetoin dehydrogenase alpha subunit